MAVGAMPFIFVEIQCYEKVPNSIYNMRLRTFIIGFPYVFLGANWP